LVSARRFFVEGTHEAGDVVEIRESDAHKIARVLRLQPGERIELIDSSANAFTASIEAVGTVVRATVQQRLDSESDTRAALAIDVAQAVPKARRMDFVIEKGTELGASAFLPFYSERNVARTVGAEKLARWRRLARTAAQQCGRREVPAIEAPLRFERLLERFSAYQIVVFAWELAPSRPLVDALRQALPASGRALVVIGPEGGFTHAEAEAASQHGALAVSLGSRILRTDTAALALLAVIGALTS